MFAVLIAVTIAFGAPNGRGEWQLVKNPKIMEKLGIDETKAKELEKILLKRDSSLIELQSKLRRKRLELKKLLLEENVDESELKKVVNEISRIKGEIKFERLKSNLRMKEILGKESWRKWKMLKKSVVAKRKARIKRLPKKFRRPLKPAPKYY